MFPGTLFVGFLVGEGVTDGANVLVGLDVIVGAEEMVGDIDGGQELTTSAQHRTAYISVGVEQARSLGANE